MLITGAATTARHRRRRRAPRDRRQRRRPRSATSSTSPAPAPGSSPASRTPPIAPRVVDRRRVARPVRRRRRGVGSLSRTTCPLARSTRNTSRTPLASARHQVRRARREHDPLRARAHARRLARAVGLRAVLPPRSRASSAARRRCAGRCPPRRWCRPARGCSPPTGTPPTARPDSDRVARPTARPSPAARRPSALAALPCAPLVATLTRVVVRAPGVVSSNTPLPSASRSCRNTSRTPLVSPATRLLASDQNATYRPLALMRGRPLAPLACVPSLATLTRATVAASRGRARRRRARRWCRR